MNEIEPVGLVPPDNTAESVNVTPEVPSVTDFGDGVVTIDGVVRILKHSVVLLVSEPDRKWWSFAPGVNSARQQYFPGALSFGVVEPLTVAEVPFPLPSRVTAEPIWAPFALQSPPFAVTSLGEQRKNLTVPTPACVPSLTVTVSCCAAPGRFDEPPGVAVVVIGGGTQVEFGATFSGARYPLRLPFFVWPVMERRYTLAAEDLGSSAQCRSMS